MIKRGIIILTLLLLASTAWAGHSGMSLGLGLGLGGSGMPSTHGPSILMESSGYVLMETGDHILTE